VGCQVTDGTGRQQACSFLVSVLDQENPTIVCPANITTTAMAGACAATVSFSSPVIGDNCASVAAPTLQQTQGLPSGSNFSVGEAVLRFVVTDGVGRTASCWFSITVIDDQPPTLTCPGDQLAANAPDACNATVAYAEPVATDNCGTASNVGSSKIGSGGTFAVGNTTELWRFVDSSSNVAVCRFVVQVVDTQPPVITCPVVAPTNSSASSCVQTVSFASPSASDNCGGFVVNQTVGAASGTAFAVGSTILGFAVTDAAGLTASCTSTVVVQDVRAPQIVCPSNMLLPNDAGLCGVVVTFAPVSVTDNCAVNVSQTAGLASGSLFPAALPGLVHSVTLRATDASGLFSSCSFTITSLDAELPVIRCPVDGTLTFNNSLHQCSAAVAFGAVNATDNCGTPTVLLGSGTLASGATFPVGTTSQSFTAMSGGTSASCGFQVTVVDAEAPC
jgi:large repetitive protein